VARRAVLIGSGALGLGFLAERLADEYALTLADVPAKQELLRRIVAEQGYTLNMCGHAGVRAQRVRGAFAMALVDEGADLEDTLKDADLVLTATGRRYLDGVVRRIAPALRARTRKVWLLFCENGRDIAAAYRAALGTQVVCVDTVMSRMCRFADPEETGYAPMWAGDASRLVVEEYGVIPLDAERCAGGPFGSAFDVVSPDEFRLWEDVKLYLHNGMHAFVAYHAALQGIERFPQVPRALRESTRVVMLTEVIPALLHTHPVAHRDMLVAYAEGLLERFFAPAFNESVARGTRGIAEKLALGERLLGGCAFIRQAGIEPVGYGSTVEAARELLARQRW
jgi:mannitol-1-phosphate/altronate dehydrogenase